MSELVASPAFGTPLEKLKKSQVSTTCAASRAAELNLGTPRLCLAPQCVPEIFRTARATFGPNVEGLFPRASITAASSPHWRSALPYKDSGEKPAS